MAHNDTHRRRHGTNFEEAKRRVEGRVERQTEKGLERRSERGGEHKKTFPPSTKAASFPGSSFRSPSPPKTCLVCKEHHCRCDYTVVNSIVTTSCCPSDRSGLTIEPCSGPVVLQSDVIEPILLFGFPVADFSDVNPIPPFPPLVPPPISIPPAQLPRQLKKDESGKKQRKKLMLEVQKSGSALRFERRTKTKAKKESRVKENKESKESNLPIPENKRKSESETTGMEYKEEKKEEKEEEKEKKKKKEKGKRETEKGKTREQENKKEKKEKEKEDKDKTTIFLGVPQWNPITLQKAHQRDNDKKAEPESLPLRVKPIGELYVGRKPTKKTTTSKDAEPALHNIESKRERKKQQSARLEHPQRPQYLQHSSTEVVGVTSFALTSAPTQGWSFVPLRSITIYQLLSGVDWAAQQLGLWGPSNALLASTTIVPGTTPEEDGMYVTDFSPPIALTAGQRYYLGASTNTVAVPYDPSEPDSDYVSSVYPCNSGVTTGFVFPQFVDFSQENVTYGNIISFRAFYGPPGIGMKVEKNKSFVEKALSVQDLQVTESAQIPFQETELGIFDQLQVRGTTRVGFGTSTPNTQSSNRLDCYGNSGMSILANASYFWNTYFDGTNFRRRQTGASGFIKMEADGNWGLALSPTTGVENSVISDFINPLRYAFGIGVIMRFQSQAQISGSFTLQQGILTPISTSLTGSVFENAFSINTTTGAITVLADGWINMDMDVFWNAPAPALTADGYRYSYLQGSGGDQVLNLEFPVPASEQKSTFRNSTSVTARKAIIGSIFTPTFIYNNSAAPTDLITVNMQLQFRWAS